MNIHWSDEINAFKRAKTHREKRHKTAETPNSLIDGELVFVILCSSRNDESIFLS